MMKVITMDFNIIKQAVFDEGYYMDADGEKPVFSDDDDDELELDGMLSSFF